MPIDIAEIRSRTKLSQAAFSSAFGVPIATLQNWEQGRTAPDATHRAFFRAIAREPETMARLLSPGPTTA